MSHVRARRKTSDTELRSPRRGAGAEVSKQRDRRRNPDVHRHSDRGAGGYFRYVGFGVGRDSAWGGAGSARDMGWSASDTQPAASWIWDGNLDRTWHRGADRGRMFLR